MEIFIGELPLAGVPGQSLALSIVRAPVGCHPGDGGGRISINYMGVRLFATPSSKSRDKTNSHRSHGGKRNVSVSLLMSLVPLAYLQHRCRLRRISLWESRKQYAICHMKISRDGKFPIHGKPLGTDVRTHARATSWNSLSSRLTKATFLSVRTQTNAKAKAIWHAALDDIWEAGSGRWSGGRGGQTIVGRIVRESALYPGKVMSCL